MGRAKINPNATHCVVGDCEREIKTAGMCNKHYTALAKERASAKKRNRCAEPGCRQEHHLKGYCKVHYFEVWNSREIAPVKHKLSRVQCTIDGCIRGQYGREVCRPHYDEMRDEIENDGIDYEDYWQWVKKYLKL